MPRQSLNDFESVVLRYSKKWFNNLYFELRKYIEDQSVRQILVYGGKSSSKTISICQVLAEKAVSKGHSTLAFRKESTLIPTTLKPSFSLAIEAHRLQNAFATFDRWFKTTWGSSIVLKGLDREEKVKGTEGFQYLYFDELNHFTKEEFDQANLSLRGQPNQKIIASWNPVNINSWVKKDFLDKYSFKDVAHTLPCPNSFVRISDDGKIVLIKTTYEDNYWIAGSPDGTYGYRDENLIHEYNKLKDLDENSYNVNVLGEWGIDDPNKLFAKDYSHAKHFGKTFQELYQPGLEVFLSWDFNIDNTCLAIQNPGNAINVLREYHIKGYDLQMLCDLIKRDFKGHDFIINGDASGKARSALTTGNATAYNLLHQYLGFSWEYQFFVPSANPSHLNSRLQTNVILKQHEVNVSEECNELDIDLRSVEVDDNGSMEAYKKKNPARTHFMDCLVAGTLIETIGGCKNIEDIEIGDLVLTRQGYKRVIDTWNSKSEVCEYSLNNHKITCTPDHKIFTKNRGFIEAKYLVNNDILCILDSWKENLLSTEEFNGIGTQIQQEEQTGFILCIINFASMFTSGKNKMVRFLKGMLSTIKTMIHLITIFLIWSALKGANTCGIMLSQTLTIDHLSPWLIWQQFALLQKSGTDRPKVWNGIENMSQIPFGKTTSLAQLYVKFVERVMKPRKDQILNSVPITVNLNTEGITKQTTFQIPATNAVLGSRTINITHESFVQERVPIRKGIKEVFDLSVEGQHEFFANGVLVHNCVRYHFNAMHKDKTK